MKTWYNYGRADNGRANEFRIILEDGGIPLILYRAFWNPKRGTYKLYPHTVFVPGEYRFEPFVLRMSEVERKKRL